MSKLPKLAESYPGLPEGYTDVAQGTCETAQLIAGDQPLGTLAVSSCTVVAVHNIETARAYLGHFLHPNSNQADGKEAFEAMVKAIKDHEDPTHPLEIWLGGTSKLGSESSEESHKTHDESLELDRQIVIATLNDLPNDKSISPDWLSDNTYIAAMTFNPMDDPAIEALIESLPLAHELG